MDEGGSTHGAAEGGPGLEASRAGSSAGGWTPPAEAYAAAETLTLTLSLTPTPTLILTLTLTLTPTLTPTLTAVARSRVKSYAVKHFWAYYKPWRQTSSFWCRRWYTFLDDDAAFGPASTQELGGATQGHGAGRSDSTWSVDSSPPATGQGGQSGQVPRASRSDSRCVRQLSATRARVLALNASDGKNKCKGVWSKVF